ncbi:expressed unknown protein [Seminavis robusta]|uniref:Uncharacterized protein n=1 Tax=Seminavis robusta TaxID=568900 RepID=A0A9N8EQ46_9STRA|nr:expressed unknown protein [Seminavis robusta]|eukprot:Sro1533_g280320.1 n/a (264) ;mRNA; f:8133-8924
MAKTGKKKRVGSVKDKRRSKKSKKECSHPMTTVTLPEDCRRHVMEFLDFSSLLAFRATGKKPKKQAESQLLRRALSSFPMTDENHFLLESENPRPGNSEYEIKVRNGFTTEWLTMEGVVDKAMECPQSNPVSDEIKAEQKKALQRKRWWAGDDILDPLTVEFFTRIIDLYKPLTPLSAWLKMVEFGIDGKIVSVDLIKRLTPLYQAVFGLLIQASSILLVRVKSDSFSSTCNLETEKVALLVRTKKGHKVQIELSRTTHRFWW